MSSLRLTDRAVMGAKPKNGKRVEYSDLQLPGLILRVNSGGQKSWVVRYRTKDGRQPRVTIGAYPVVDLATARDKAIEILRAVRLGEDPAAAKRRSSLSAKAPTVRTVNDLAEVYFASCERGEWKPKRKQKRKATLAWERELYERHLKTLIGKLDIKELDKDTVRAALRAIVARGAPVQANRSFALLRQMVNFAVAEDMLNSTPVIGVVAPAAESPRARVLTEGELQLLWRALETPEAFNSADGEAPFYVSRQVRIAIQMALLLLQRRGEIAGMRRSEIDLAQGTWIIPGERTKNGRPHLVPLPATAIVLLKEAITLAGEGELVFPTSRGPRRPITSPALSHALRRIYAALGIAGATLHDLRRTGATFMASERLSIPPHIVSRVLGHITDAGGGANVTARHYNSYNYALEKRGALEAWDRLLLGLVAGSERNAD